ncbi:COG4705 family protein [Protofrankia symbiont of Coriaria ruscifolia]|uniref:COG4705 family protein n=1 Tax=Protofrankia symbiont of Coriaria ruscifolia TaxID=1306542 RepID=UPI0010419838|nr:hypothetical protein [Protofrankia symbiont of Coriaria ruscifolia]
MTRPPRVGHPRHESGPNKIPQITLFFWITKIVATTLGETGGDLLSQTLKVGYAVSSMIFIGLFMISLVTQVRADSLHPGLYWTAILTTSMAGTTISDFMNRTAGLGYTRGALVLVTILLLVFMVWRYSGHSFDVTRIVTFKGEMLYWTAILVSNTLGTSLGDFLSDSSGLGYAGGAILIWSLLLLIASARYHRRVPNTLLFWMAFVLTRPMGATLGDFFTKPTVKGGLGYGTAGSSMILLAVLVVLIVEARRRQVKQRRKPLSRSAQHDAR